MKINRFEELEVWQLSRVFVKDIYFLTNKTNFAHEYNLVSQIQRASVSIMLNIAEGFERQSNKEFSRFLYISKASCGEVRSILYILIDLNIINHTEFDELFKKCELISKSLSGFINYLNKPK